MVNYLVIYIIGKPWKDPPFSFLITVKHLFLWAISHGYVTNNQRVIRQMYGNIGKSTWLKSYS